MLANRLTGWLRPLLTLAALAGVLSLAACGGGGGSPNNPYQPGGAAPTIAPASANGYSGVPFTFTVSGGTPPYAVTSGNVALLQVPQTASGDTFAVLPGNVSTATPVSVTVSDVIGRQAVGSITINPAVLLPTSIKITGNPNCSASGATLCSGQDGSASVTVTGAGGVGLAGRQIRFDVVQGDFSISPPGQPAVQTLTVTTDQNGSAAVRLVVPVSAPTQFASIRATDVTSGSTVVSQFTIAQYIDGSSVLSVIPAGATTFTGADDTHCASGVTATVYIFGGTPPYTVAASYPQLVQLGNVPVQHSGGGFGVTPVGVCFTGLTLAITDATGRTLLTPPTFDNVYGPAPVAPPTLAITPTAVTATTACTTGTSFPFIVTGGTGTYAAVISPTTNASLSTNNPTQGTAFLANISATGTYTIAVTSGTQSVTAKVTCP